MGEWARVVWLEGDVEEEGTIPSCWITDDSVFWPNGINVLRAMSEMRQRNEKWKPFKLVKVKITSKDRTLCEDYNFTSAELSNEYDEEITQTQSKKSNREKCRTPSPPPPLRTQFSSKKGGLSSSSSKSRVSKQRSRSRSPCKRSRSNSSDSSTSLQSYTSPQAEKQSCRSNEFSECIDSNQKSHQGKQRSKSCLEDIHSSGDSMADSLTPKVKRGSIGSDIFPMPEGRFQKRVLFLLTDIKENIKLVARKYENSDSDCYLDQITEPQQLQELEKELSSSSDAKTQMISRVSKIGGISLKDNVSKVTNRLMNNELMSSMNLKGNGGKIAFSKTELYNIIITCVLKNHKGKEHDVGQAIASCLKYAPDRKGGKRQKPQGENKED